MTPQEIAETVAARFPLLLYQGYPAAEDPPENEDGQVILWPRELRRALRSYGSKVGLVGFLEAEVKEINPKTKTVDLPEDFLEINMCKDRLGVYVKARIEEEETPDGTRKVLKLTPANWRQVRYPLRIDYFVRLTSYIGDNRELPPDCDCDLICDYLEALVGEINAQYNSALESFDLESGQKSRAEYLAQRKRCEAEFNRLRKSPGITATGF